MSYNPASLVHELLPLDAASAFETFVVERRMRKCVENGAQHENELSQLSDRCKKMDKV